MLLFAALYTAAAPSAAHASDAPYYGPMKGWGPIGYKFGYKDSVEKDGSWHVSVTTRRGAAIDIAMYRAAEMARDLGYPYVELFGGWERRTPGMGTAELYARPSRSAADPTTCRSKRRRTCYTADVGEVLRILGGPDGTQPGVPIVDHVDEHGNWVSYSGFGIGAASATPFRPTPPAPKFALAPLAQRMTTPARPNAPAGSTTDFDRARKAAQPIRGKEPKLGWTISD
ncbi:hypothetical protein U1707_15110 [Sphingomonas sp. PB2P12]